MTLLNSALVLAAFAVVTAFIVVVSRRRWGSKAATAAAIALAAIFLAIDAALRTGAPAVPIALDAIAIMAMSLGIRIAAGRVPNRGLIGSAALAALTGMGAFVLFALAGFLAWLAFG